MERLYGWLEGDLEAAAGRLEVFLGRGEPHESLYLGGDYYEWRLGGADVRLQSNLELPGELAELDFPEYPLLVWILGTMPGHHWDERAATLGLVQLR